MKFAYFSLTKKAGSDPAVILTEFSKAKKNRSPQRARIVRSMETIPESMAKEIQTKQEMIIAITFFYRVIENNL